MRPSTTALRWQVFTSAPHRVMFFAGALQTALVMLLWLAELLGRAALWWPTLPMVLPSMLVHTFLMLYGVFPFFIFGFLLTVYPRWMGGPVVPTTRYIASFALLSCGMLLFYAGLFISRRLLVLALAAQLIGWGLVLYSLLAVYRQARNRGPHERLLNLALLTAMIGILCFLYGVVTGSGLAFQLARELGLWLFLLPVVFTVGHRMIPFFSQSALINYIMVRPSWGLPVMVVCAAAHVVLEVSGLTVWRFLADAPLAAAALHHSWVWQFRRSFHARLLAMLHIAFLWLGIGMTLYTVQSLVLFVTGTDLLGRAPLHALGIGFFTGMVVAMASRVTLGHSGRALEANDLTWRVLFGVNIAAVMRIVAEFLPGTLGNTFSVLAALTWLVSFLLWNWLYAPMYLYQRLDQKPG
jgi:uncharacterized protein involved in response to NO